MSLFPAGTLFPGSTIFPGVAPDAPPIVDVPPAPESHTWAAFARAADYSLAMGLPIQKIQLVVRHLGVGRAVLNTPYSYEAWTALGPTCGIVLYRDGRQEFTGLVETRELNWDAEAGTVEIRVECVGDEVHLADRLAMPDPLRAADDQSVNDYWTSGSVPASTAMLKLISDQAGPTCRTDRRVDGLTLGDNPGVGAVRNYKALFQPVMDVLGTISRASGENLGVRAISEPGSLEVGIYAPADLRDVVIFSADIGNLTGLKFTESAPATTNALAAGKGNLHARLRRTAAAGTVVATRWGRQVWEYVDRRDTDDTAELTTAAQDAVETGIANTISLSMVLLDSQAATYGRDWGLGDLVTVYVGLPGATKVEVINNVVREISFDVDENGSERVRPVVGSYDARDLSLPIQRSLVRVGRKVGELIVNQ